MPYLEPDDEIPPKTQAEVEKGGSKKPPRRSAVGLGDFGEFKRSRKSGMWDYYVSTLVAYFNRMSRRDQEQLFTRIFQIVITVNAVALTAIFYPFLPAIVKLCTLPPFIVGSWFVAQKVVAPLLIARYDIKVERVVRLENRDN